MRIAILALALLLFAGCLGKSAPSMDELNNYEMIMLKVNTYYFPILLSSTSYVVQFNSNKMSMDDLALVLEIYEGMLEGVDEYLNTTKPPEGLEEAHSHYLEMAQNVKISFGLLQAYQRNKDDKFKQEATFVLLLAMKKSGEADGYYTVAMKKYGKTAFDGTAIKGYPTVIVSINKLPPFDPDFDPRSLAAK